MASEVRVEMLITSVSREIENYLGRQVTLDTSVSETFDVEGGQWEFFLDAYPVESITDVFSSSARTFDSTTALDADTFVVNSNSGILTIDKVIISQGRQSLRVDYVGGMAGTLAVMKTKFFDVHMACVLETAARLRKRGAETLASVSVAGGAVTYVPQGNQFVPEVEKLLGHHKRGF